MGYFRTNPPCELWRKLKCRLFAWFNSYAFGAFGKHNYLFDLELLNPQNIFLGSNLWISKTRLASSKGGKLIIGNHVAIGRFSQIYALQSIIIEDGVLMAENTLISDNTHTFTDITTPVRDQDIKPFGDTVNDLLVVLHRIDSGVQVLVYAVQPVAVFLEVFAVLLQHILFYLVQTGFIGTVLSKGFCFVVDDFYQFFLFIGSCVEEDLQNGFFCAQD